MNTEAGVIDRLLRICQFVLSTPLENLDLEMRSKVELALDLDEQQLAHFYQELCAGEWPDNATEHAVISSCEMAMAACLVLNGRLWDEESLHSWRDAEQALRAAREFYLEAIATIQSAAQDVQVFAC